MANENKKLVGIIEGGTNGAPLAGIQVIGADGVIREVKVGDYIYEGENIVSTNPQASVEVKYLALSKVVTYDGVFNILVDNSVSSQSDETENSLSQDIIPNTLFFFYHFYNSSSWLFYWQEKL